MVMTENDELLIASKSVTSDIDIDYGGVDEGGNKEPSARRYDDVWEDEEED